MVKNKVAPPFRLAEFDILFGSGIDHIGCLIDGAEECGVIERSGSWYSKGELRIAQGRRSAIEFLKSHSQLAAEIEEEVRKIIQKKSDRQHEELMDDFKGNVRLLNDGDVLDASLEIEMDMNEVEATESMRSE